MNKGRRKACICSAPTARYVLCAGVILGRGGRKKHEGGLRVQASKTSVLLLPGHSKQPTQCGPSQQNHIASENPSLVRTLHMNMPSMETGK